MQQQYEESEQERKEREQKRLEFWAYHKKYEPQLTDTQIQQQYEQYEKKRKETEQKEKQLRQQYWEFLQTQNITPEQYEESEKQRKEQEQKRFREQVAQTPWQTAIAESRLDIIDAKLSQAVTPEDLAQAADALLRSNAGYWLVNPALRLHYLQRLLEKAQSISTKCDQISDLIRNGLNASVASATEWARTHKPGRTRQDYEAEFRPQWQQIGDLVWTKANCSPPKFVPPWAYYY